MFEFNFFESDDKGNDNQNHIESLPTDQVECEPFEEINLSIQDSINYLSKNNDSQLKSYQTPKGLLIKHVSFDIVMETMKENKKVCSNVLEADEKSSDLLSGAYEGGLKIWECTIDLINYIENNLDVAKKKCLDLGCGAGILGIFALMKDSSSVYFQDYNAEVIKYVTIPNVMLNVTKPDCRCFAGDWTLFKDHLCTEMSENDKFDCIFTSETIYNTKSYSKLHSLFESCLKKSGEIYLAAKTFYFGVGGGTRQFEDFLEERNVFKSSVCWKCNEGVMREILKITFK